MYSYHFLPVLFFLFWYCTISNNSQDKNEFQYVHKRWSKGSGLSGLPKWKKTPLPSHDHHFLIIFFTVSILRLIYSLISFFTVSDRMSMSIQIAVIFILCMMNLSIVWRFFLYFIVHEWMVCRIILW